MSASTQFTQVRRVMSIHHVSRMRNTAMVVFVSTTLAMALSTATADSSSPRGARQAKPREAACTRIERPKHTISKCRCSTGALSGMTSIDAAEIIRLLTGDQGCRNPTVPRK